MNTRTFQYILIAAVLSTPLSAFAQAVCPVAVRCQDGVSVATAGSNCAFDCGNHGNPSLSGMGSDTAAPSAVAPVQAAGMVGGSGTFGAPVGPAQAPLSPAVGGPFFGGMISSSPAPTLPVVPNAALQMIGGGSFGAGNSMSDVAPVKAMTVYSIPISSWVSSILNASFSSDISTSPSNAPVVTSNADSMLKAMTCTQDASLCAGQAGTIGGSSSVTPTPIVTPAPAMIAPVPCAATAIKCADGTVILPGPDCTYHFSCLINAEDRAPAVAQPTVQAVEGGMVAPPAYFAGSENNTFAAVPQQPIASDQSFGSRTGAFAQGVLGIGKWISQLFR